MQLAQQKSQVEIALFYINLLYRQKNIQTNKQQFPNFLIAFDPVSTHQAAVLMNRTLLTNTIIDSCIRIHRHSLIVISQILHKRYEL